MIYKAHVITATGAKMIFRYESEGKLGSKKNMDDARKCVGSIILNREWRIEKLEKEDAPHDPLQGLTIMFDEEMQRQSGLIEND